MVIIIIPAYNAGEYIRDAVDSVLQQICKDIEIIVVDHSCPKQFMTLGHPTV